MASLSGGEAQRVFLATALVQEPRYILLDEPTTYLDIHYQYQVLDTIRTLKDHYHITFIMVLHDINQAIEYSDEVICLNDKGVIAQGAPQEVINETILKEMYQIDAKVINDSECGMIVCRKRVRIQMIKFVRLIQIVLIAVILIFSYQLFKTYLEDKASAKRYKIYNNNLSQSPCLTKMRYVHNFLN